MQDVCVFHEHNYGINLFKKKIFITNYSELLRNGNMIYIFLIMT